MQIFQYAMYMEVIIYLLLYQLHYCTFTDINFRGFHGLLAIPRKLIQSNMFFRSVI